MTDEIKAMSRPERCALSARLGCRFETEEERIVQRLLVNAVDGDLALDAHEWMKGKRDKWKRECLTRREQMGYDNETGLDEGHHHCELCTTTWYNSAGEFCPECGGENVASLEARLEKAEGPFHSETLEVSKAERAMWRPALEHRVACHDTDAQMALMLLNDCDIIEARHDAANEAWASLAEDVLGEAPATPEQQRAAIDEAFAAYRAPFELCDQCMTASIEHDVHSPSHTFVSSGEYIDAETYTAGGDHV